MRPRCFKSRKTETQFDGSVRERTSTREGDEVFSVCEVEKRA